MLTELFELSQIDSPEFSLKLVKTDICEYIRQICGELVPQLEREGFKYEFDISEERVFVMLDTNRFSRIIQNLANNAMQYNQRNIGYLKIDSQNQQVVIEFSDNGIGIPEHLADSIFKPFVRGDDSLNSKTGGGGLDLHSEKIAEAHGGFDTMSQ